MKFKLGDTVYLVYENVILKGFIINIDKKEKKWDDDYYDVDVSQSNYLTGISDTIYNLLNEELYKDVSDLINSLQKDLQGRIIRKSL